MEEKTEKAKVGDIKPIYQIVGFEVVKRLEGEEPIVITVEKPFEAEVLSALFKKETKI